MILIPDGLLVARSVEGMVRLHATAQTYADGVMRVQRSGDIDVVSFSSRVICFCEQST